MTWAPLFRPSSAEYRASEAATKRSGQLFDALRRCQACCSGNTVADKISELWRFDETLKRVVRSAAETFVGEEEEEKLIFENGSPDAPTKLVTS